MSDESFEQFLKSHSGGTPSTPMFVMITIKSKMDGIANMYKDTLDFLKSEPKESLTRKKAENFAGLLISKAELTIDQFDYLIADTMDEEDPKEENNDK